MNYSQSILELKIAELEAENAKLRAVAEAAEAYSDGDTAAWVTSDEGRAAWKKLRDALGALHAQSTDQKGATEK